MYGNTHRWDEINCLSPSTDKNGGYKKFSLQ